MTKDRRLLSRRQHIIVNTFRGFVYQLICQYKYQVLHDYFGDQVKREAHSVEMSLKHGRGGRSSVGLPSDASIFTCPYFRLFRVFFGKHTASRHNLAADISWPPSYFEISINGVSIDMDPLTASYRLVSWICQYSRMSVRNMPAGTQL